ncbi:MAG TPA: ferrochelatase [Acidimicrobiales bacterium]|nr:ferrochelatase [Acidimicrobiales bacterium]
MADVGVLVMSYGTPSGPDGIEAYYTDIRRGHPPTAEQLADLRRRYDAIGGVSPLAERTAAQVAGLQVALDATDPGRFAVFSGAKHSTPSIEDGMNAIATAGLVDVVALVLAPHYSALSVGQYFERVDAAATDNMAVTYVHDWHLEPVLVDLLAERVGEALARFSGDAVVETLVTAHSLPARVVDMDDPYPGQVAATAEAVAEAAGLTRWQVAWQSAARTPEPWLGPDVLDVIPALASTADGVLVCPAGFVSDHLEILYDLDVQAREVAESAGLRFERTASLNDDKRFLAMLADVVRVAAA